MMSAIESMSYVWIVRDPRMSCGCVSRVCMVERRMARDLQAVRDEPDYHQRHPVAWLTEAEAMRDFRSRARLWKALRRRWAVNARAVLR